MGRLELAKHNWFADRAENEKLPSPETASALGESEDELEKAAVETLAIFSANLHLLPVELAKAISDSGDALASLENQTEIQRVLDRLGAVLDPYLPELPRRGGMR